jgi:hypothetical protein
MAGNILTMDRIDGYLDQRKEVENIFANYFCQLEDVCPLLDSSKDNERA